MPAQVIPAQRWRHVTGRTASASGSVPWASSVHMNDWTLEHVGWTIKHPDGTTGLGRPPFATRAEAQAWVDAHPTFQGMRQD